MAKKKVMSVLGILLLFAAALTVISLSDTKGVTGNAISSNSYSEELFIGNNYEFGFYPSNVDDLGGAILIKGTLSEMGGKEHILKITAYAIGEGGEILGEYQGDISLVANDRMLVRFSIPYQNDKEVYQLALYFDDGRTMTRGTYSFRKSALVGSAIENISSEEGSRTLTFMLFILVAFLIVLGVVKSYKKHNKEMHFSHSMHSKESRRYIDLDIR